MYLLDRDRFSTNHINLFQQTQQTYSIGLVSPPSDYIVDRIWIFQKQPTTMGRLLKK